MTMTDSYSYGKDLQRRRRNADTEYEDRLKATIQSQAETIERLKAEAASAGRSMCVMQDDLSALLRALGIPDCARPASPHRVMEDEALPAVRLLTARIAELEAAVAAGDQFLDRAALEGQLSALKTAARELAMRSKILRCKCNSIEMPGVKCNRCLARRVLELADD